MPKLSSLPSQSNVPIQKSEMMEFAYRLAPHIILCCGALSAPLTGKEVIAINGVSALKPYLVAMLPTDGGSKLLMLVRVESSAYIDDFPEIKISTDATEISWKYRGMLRHDDASFTSFVQQLNEASVTKLLLLLIKLSQLDNELAASPAFIERCLQCRARLTPDSPSIPKSFWLLPNVLYAELTLPSGDYSEARLLTVSSRGMLAASVRLFQLKGNNYAMLAIFSYKEAMKRVDDALFSLMMKDRLVAIPAPADANELNAGGLITHLSQMPALLRLNVRDFVVREMLTMQDTRGVISSLVRTLQSYLLPTHTSLCDKNLPVGMNIEVAFPLQQEGLCVSGWMHDPLSLVESVLVTTDLGFAVSFKNNMHFYPRPDVAALYEESSFPVHDDKCGFVAYVEYPSELRKKLPRWATPFAMRFTITLKTGMRYTIAPKPETFDPAVLRDHLLTHVASRVDSASSAAKAINIAGRHLQQSCTAQVKVSRRETFGVEVEDPAVSVVIPLYRALEYLPSQIAHFAQDPFMKQVEVIYVLDSPEQERVVVEQLRHLSLLYRFPMTLLVLSRNGGFSTATNMGAAAARSGHLLLLNSDVVPIRNGWLERMLTMYGEYPTIGALAPKLLYSDDSIQHAGMFFALHSSGDFYENLHYFKGYPASHPAANVGREVPAVTAACMLIAKNKFEAVGGFSTDYIIGDFEDSDFCLRLHEQGLLHYYMAEEALYHFERQSMNALIGNHTPRYWLNAMTQQMRWGEIIPKVMELYV
jgi:GT2 family glycosyltransferase